MPASTSLLDQAETEAAAPPPLTIYRVFFRKSKKAGWPAPHPEQLVEGKRELERILARPRPKAIHWEIALIHQCSVCDTIGPWRDGWSWFGSESDLKAGRPIRKFCSSQCWPKEKMNQKRPEGVEWEDWPRVSGFEPDPAGAVRERWRILREVGDTTAHRKVPMPDWPGPGTCRWCLKPTIVESGKRIGKPAPGRNWHNACYYKYELHTVSAVQFSFLFSRDGPRCQICGDGGYAEDGTYDRTGWTDGEGQLLYPITYLKPSIRLEVDHVIPLWRAADYALASRQALYGPTNLWLLCSDCHKAKSAIEAAERAAR